MNEERTQVLQLLANGKINVEEAQALLKALATGEKETAEPARFAGRPRWAPRRARPPRPPRMGRRGQADVIDQVLHLRIHGVDGHFIAEMKEMGFSNLTADELTALKIHEVTPRYIEEIRAAGFEDITVDQLLSLATHGVDADFIEEMRDATGRDLTIEQLVKLRIHDVTADVFAEILSLGIVDVEPAQKSPERVDVDDEAA